MVNLYQKSIDLKYSGVEWLEKIPHKWIINRGKYLLQSRKEINNDMKCDNVLSLTMKGVLHRSELGEGGLLPSDYSTFQIFYPKDLVFKLIDLNNYKTSRVGMVDEKGIMSSAYIRIFSKNNDVYQKYFYYFYYNLYLQGIYNFIGMGVRSTMNAQELLELRLIKPSYEEQKRIANWLDLKTKIIDQIIEKKKKLIELLKEKRISIITQAVTKGLDSKTKMKPSGVEWIGEIPEGWKIKKLKFCFRLLQEKSDEAGIQNKISLENIESWTGKYIYTDVEYSGSGVKFKMNDILFGKLRPYLAKVYKGENEGIAFGDILVYRPSFEITSDFSFYSFISYRFIELINSHTYGVKMPRSNPETIGSLIFLIPSKKEQNTIVEFLKKELTNNNKIIEIQNIQIDKLIEYRSSLIYNMVTGKIKNLN